MARKRMIDPGFWTDEKVGALPIPARLLFMGLISNADDDGRLPGHSSLVRSLVFPYDSDIAIQDIDEWLGLLAERGLIQRYRVNGQNYIFVRNFSKHQYIKKKQDSKLPAPPSEETELEPVPHQYPTSGEPVGNQYPTSGPQKKRKERNGIKTESEPELSDPLPSSDPTPQAPAAPCDEEGGTAEAYWQKYNGRKLGPKQAKSINHYRSIGFSDSMIIVAMDKAIKASANLNYVFAVLDAWRQQGLSTLEDVEREAQQFHGRGSPSSDVPQYLRQDYV